MSLLKRIFGIKEEPKCMHQWEVLTEHTKTTEKYDMWGKFAGRYTTTKLNLVCKKCGEFKIIYK